MKFQTKPTEVRHQIGTCPACQCGLWATVTVHVEGGMPLMTPDGKATVSAWPVFDGMSIEHACERDDEGQWMTAAPPSPTVRIDGTEIAKVVRDEMDAQKAWEREAGR